MFPTVLLGFLQISLASSNTRPYKILNNNPSPLTIMDPPELEFLHHTSYDIQFTGGTTYNNITYHLNWSKEMIFPGNRRFWYANFASDKTVSPQIFLRRNRTTCVYDVTDNAGFILLHKTIPTNEDYKNFVIIQCPLDDCTVEDFGCGRRPFPWGWLVFIASFLFLSVMLLQIRKNGTFLALLEDKLKTKEHLPLPTEGKEIA